VADVTATLFNIRWSVNTDYCMSEYVAMIPPGD
jgi:hypothetical protein